VTDDETMVPVKDWKGGASHIGGGGGGRNRSSKRDMSSSRIAHDLSTALHSLTEVPADSTSVPSGPVDPHPSVTPSTTTPRPVQPAVVGSPSTLVHGYAIDLAVAGEKIVNRNDSDEGRNESDATGVSEQPSNEGNDDETIVRTRTNTLVAKTDVGLGIAAEVEGNESVVDLVQLWDESSGLSRGWSGEDEQFSLNEDHRDNDRMKSLESEYTKAFESTNVGVVARNSSIDSQDIQILVQRPSPIKEIPTPIVPGVAGGVSQDFPPNIPNEDYQPLHARRRILADMMEPPATAAYRNRTTFQDDDGVSDASLVNTDPVLSRQDSEPELAEPPVILSHTSRSMSDGAVKSGAVKDEGVQRVGRARPISGPAYCSSVTTRGSDGATGAGLGPVADLNPLLSSPLLYTSGMSNTRRQRSFPALTELTDQRGGSGAGAAILRTGSYMSCEKLRLTSGPGSDKGQNVMGYGGFKLRSRNASGLETPLSAIDTMSLASTGEAGEIQFIRYYT